MFNAIRRVLRQTNIVTTRAPAAADCVQGLERRWMLAGDVPLVAQAFFGPAEAVTSIMLTFAVPLDPATASNADAYRITTVTKNKKDGLFGGGLIGGGLFGGDGSTERDTHRIRLASASYDATTGAVTLTPRKPFEVRKSFKSIRVAATGARAVLGADGTPIDGNDDGRPGGDVVVRYRANARRSLKIREADGDRATLRLAGPGRILYLAPGKGRSSPTLFFRNTDPVASVLSGTVKRGKRGDGVIDIAQVSGTSTAQVAIATDPAFRVRALTP